ncbi:ankyrin [Pseudovirgaria hyperparasitica]|uniref:Ankyrin n=1 Tax=Pseudovirgaria hyperparasitica TaxID=470096 RepID=A0A6A6WDP0_9PEZI|nr:ankyrin [Pseudovirgaria hyperparasitica]KAF2760174.1 ankyrin [Pseudovirgaria hyperparasitica]
MASRIDVSRRLRRAIILNDLTLVQRIVRNNPHALQNPDFDEKSNTSLHLAAKEGFLEIATDTVLTYLHQRFLIKAGHENAGISRNADWDTPLMLAAQNQHVSVGELLVRAFPRCVPWTNKAGMDALMLSARAGTTALLPTLLTSPSPSSVHLADRSGNTALHHASAAGELKAVRLLLQFGASPVAQNAFSWTPIAYSATAAAEQYFKTLVAEIEAAQKKDQLLAGGGTGGGGGNGGAHHGMNRRPGGGGGVRLVTSEDVLGRAVDDGSILPAPPRVEWSPVEQRRAMTPTTGRSEWIGAAGQRVVNNMQQMQSGLRARAHSGD